ncbi:hypothetical protein HK098_005332 [Nowakowskiella sp. JEL0407]|nr:hypothetical protein HK098_005332 [Nowakowskiella sp. JEL0407]
MSEIAKVLTIAGSDSGGGAGIQADLKTFTALGVYGTSVLTALTAQNTLGVQSIHACPPDFVLSQLDSVLGDIGADAVKTGMLFNANIINTVTSKLIEYQSASQKPFKIVIDPVMISTTGHRLLSSDSIEALNKLMPLATIITPNVPEAEILAGSLPIKDLDDMKAVAKELKSRGPEYVLIKGGHLPMTKPESDGESTIVLLSNNIVGDDDLSVVDILYDGVTFIEFWKPHVDTNNTHGTGCTLSAAIAAGLGKGLSVRDATELGLHFVSNAMIHAQNINIGGGSGPLNHIHAIPQINPPRSKFVDQLISSCSKEWEAYIDHPFVRGLADGTLPTECFKHYIRQDYIYLTHYARAYALAAFKEHHMEDVAAAAGIVVNIFHESKLHIEYCKSWGISLQELEATKEATANLSYTRYFLEKGLSGDRLDLYVAMAPCLFGYGEIGRRLLNDPKTKREGNPYWKWISNYGKEEFQGACKSGEDIYLCTHSLLHVYFTRNKSTELLVKLYHETVPTSNSTRMRQLCDVFRQATILEIKFWDMGLHIQD